MRKLEPLLSLSNKGKITKGTGGGRAEKPSSLVR